jgi:hydrogenase expression/formation protein HypD
LKYIDEYRKPGIINALVDQIHEEARGDYRLMEVCGSHTHAIRKHGIPSLLPDNIQLLSGPGCPVCVTSQTYIDQLIQLSGMEKLIIATYGDLIRVPGSEKSMQDCREEGAEIRIVYSSLEALAIADSEPDKLIVFAGIGFETTAPATAVAVRKAYENNTRNFKVLSAHKIMPPAMEAVIVDGARVDGYLCPGHVSAITGSSIYDIFPEKYKVGTVISGFEPTDILLSVLMLIRQVNSRKFRTKIQYRRAVSIDGNLVAQKVMNEVFEKKDEEWRGLGILPLSGLKLKKQYSEINASKHFVFNSAEAFENPGCICGDILKGLKNPEDCSLFGTVCNPTNPVGACMVSSEGSCNAWLKWK